MKIFKKNRFGNGCLLLYSLATVGLVAIMHVILSSPTSNFATLADALIAKYDESGSQLSNVAELQEKLLKTRFPRDTANVNLEKESNDTLMENSSEAIVLSNLPTTISERMQETPAVVNNSPNDSSSNSTDSPNVTSTISKLEEHFFAENSFTYPNTTPSWENNNDESNANETSLNEANIASVDEDPNCTNCSSVENITEWTTTTPATTTTVTTTKDPCEGIVNAPSSLFFPPYHLKPYQIRARWSKINSPVPLKFNISYYHMSSLMGYGITENYTYNIPNLMPCKDYAVCVVVLFEGCGQSEIKCNNVTTATSLSETVVQNLTANCNAREAHILFNRPITDCPIHNYNITVNDTENTEHWVYASNERVHYTIKRLKPFTSYNFTVWAENMTYLSQRSWATCKTKPSKPSKVRNEKTNCSDATNIICNWDVPETFNGEFGGYYIKISQCLKEHSNSCLPINSSIWMGKNYKYKGQPGTTYKFTIQAKTETVGLGDVAEVFCTTPPLDNSSEIILLVIASCLIIILVIIILGFVLVALQRRNIIKLPCHCGTFGMSECQTQTSSSMSIPFRATSKPVRLVDFEEHYRTMSADSSFKFSQEFEELNFVSPQWPTTVAQTNENRPKNRWINILPFDHSRVKLLPIADDVFTDYINASYIPGYRSQREFIASQGPLPNTKDDFWRMVWEQNSPMIVMVTQCTERGKVKCEQYWPEDRETHYYGDLAVTLKSESILTGYTLRIFDLQLKMPIITSPTAIDLSDLLELIPRNLEIEKGSRTMEVKQMHFTMWPDFGSPENTSLLLNFVGSVRDHMPHESTGPIVVHCSAGVGRTGTFIAVDKLMQHIEDHDFVDIYGTVREMRNYRTNMVQSEDQYTYIHECVKDLLDDMQTRKSVSKDNGESIVDIIGMAQTNPPDVIEQVGLVTETTALLSVTTATSALTADTVVSDNTSLLSEHCVPDCGPLVHAETVDSSGNNPLCLTNTNSTLHDIDDTACNRPADQAPPEINFGLTDSTQNECPASDVWFF